MGATYDPRDIEVLDGLEAIRRRPGLFVGDAGDSRTLAACVVECVRTLMHVDASRLIVTIEDDLAFEIVGENAGLSTDVRVVEAAFASIACGCQCIHTRRPMVPECNPAVTNALCASFEVEAIAEAACTRVRWRGGKLDTRESLESPAAPPRVRIRGGLDRQIFGDHAAPITHELDPLLDDLAVLAAGVRIHRLDARDGSTREYHAPAGLADRVATRGVHDPLRFRREQEDGCVMEIALGWEGEGAAHVDAWSAGWRHFAPASLGESLLAALAEVLLPIPRHRHFDRGPHAALGANLTRGLVAAIAVDTPKSSLAHVELPTGDILKPVLAPYLLARPALLERLARQIGETAAALAARLSSG